MFSDMRIAYLAANFRHRHSSSFHFYVFTRTALISTPACVYQLNFLLFLRDSHSLKLNYVSYQLRRFTRAILSLELHVLCGDAIVTLASLG